MTYVDILSRLEKEYNINLIDFAKNTNWGLYKNKPVLIDLGYTRYVSDTFYKETK